MERGETDRHTTTEMDTQKQIRTYNKRDRQKDKTEKDKRPDRWTDRNRQKHTARKMDRGRMGQTKMANQDNRVVGGMEWENAKRGRLFISLIRNLL